MANSTRFWRRSSARPGIDQELQFHIEESADAYEAAGLTRQEALRRARVELGGIPQVAERVGDVWAWRWWDDLRRDLQFAARSYVRTPVSAITAVLTLALGIGVNTALFSIVRQVLLNPLPVAAPQELVQIDCQSGPGATGGAGACLHSYPAFRLLSDRRDGLAAIVAFSPVPNGLVASFDGRREVVTGQLASGNIFEVLGVRPAAGRLLQDRDDRQGAEMVAVISHGYWLRAFGADPAVVGKALSLNDRSVTIAGVLPRAFRGVTFGETYDVVLPLAAADAFRRVPQSGGTPTSILHVPNIGWLTFLGRRQPGVAPEEVGKRLEPVFRQAAQAWLAPIPLDVRKRLGLTLDGLRVNVRPAALGAASSMRRTLEPTLRVLTIIAVLILLIACANLAGLFLAQATARQREFGLRLALGAGRSRLVRQVFTESLVLAAMGGALGLLLAQWVGPAGFNLATDDTGLRALDLGLDRWMLGATAALSVLAGLIVGAGSVLRASATSPQEALRSLRGRGSPRLTTTLLTAQIALTVTLVGSAALFLQTLTNYRRLEVGFEPNRLLTATADPGLGALERPRAVEYVTRAAEAIAVLPGVHAVTYANRPIGAGVPINLAVDAPGFVAADASSASSGVVSAGPAFVRTLGLTLVAGRDFEPTDREGSPPVAIVNESFAQHFFGGSSALGQAFAVRGPGNLPITVVGIVKDVRDGGLKRPTQRVMYIPFGHREVNTATFTVRAASDVSGLAESMRRTLMGLDPAVGVSRMGTADAQLEDGVRRERLLAGLGVAFGGLALLLMAVGLYGMLNTMVVRRSTEIGVRMALGATRTDIVRMVARETILMLAVGTAAGLAGYRAAGRLIESELFGVTANDFTAAAAAVAALAVIATLAVWMPTRRATRIDPTEALRHDHA